MSYETTKKQKARHRPYNLIGNTLLHNLEHRLTMRTTAAAAIFVTLWCGFASGFTSQQAHSLCRNANLVSPSSSALSAQKPKKKNASSSTTKGFGTFTPPPTLEETLSGFPTRLPAPEDIATSACPCGSGSIYTDCCAVFHRGEAFPQSPEKVLRSRYSAFYYRLPGFIMESTHEECRDFQEDKVDWAKNLHKGGMFDSYDFVGLEVGTEEAGSADNEAFLDFKVQLRANAKSSKQLEGEMMTVMEKSRFLRDEKGYRYAGGDVRTDVAGIEDVVLNS
jgi:SEC-C motif-containing protein